MNNKNTQILKNLIRLTGLKISSKRLKNILDDIDDLSDENLITELLKKKLIKKEEAERFDGANIENMIKVIEKNNIRVLTHKTKNYPYNLRNLSDSPPILYCSGIIEKTDSNAVAIVGTRRATEYGLTFARNLAKNLASRGLVIVSGLAGGIDSQAHYGALEGGGRTIAVMGTGIDKIYPSYNLNLADEIKGNGALLTELPPFEDPLPYHFPARNRIISGLSKAVIAIQAPMKSGVFSTVKWALEYGRDVYALPGNVTSDVSRGTNELIKMGAIPFTDYEDILENSDFEILEDNKRNVNSKLKVEDLPEDEKKVYEKITENPKNLDILSRETGVKPQRLMVILEYLELKGYIHEVGGKRFVRDK